MIIKILFFIWVLFICVLLFVLTEKWIRSKGTYQFQNYNKTDIPYISIDIQGKRMNMLVDTCCAVSIISKKALTNLKYEESKRKVSVSAMTDDSIPSDMVDIPLSVNGKSYIGEFVIYEEDDIARFEFKYGITIHGILGKEFFEDTKCHIDFSNHTIVFA